METKHISNKILLSLLIHCAKATPAPHDLIAIQNHLNMLSNHFDDLIALSYAHACLPILYKTLQAHFPKHPLVSTLKVHYLYVSKKNIAMSVSLIKVINLFKTHGITCLAFKGPVLAIQIYGDLTLRQYGDLDLFIHPKDKQKAITLLISNEYVTEIDLKKTTIPTFLKAVNVLGFHTPSQDVFIEIHWELLSKNYAVTWEEAFLWNNVSSVQVHHQPIQTLDFEPSFLYLCVHGSKHLFERLGWICDIDRTIRSQKHINWELLLNKSKQFGITRIFLLSLYLSHVLLDLPLPQTIKKEIHQDKTISKLTQHIIALHFTQKKRKKNYQTFKLLWMMRENMSDKLRLLKLAILIPKFDDFKAIQLPSYLSFLYPLLRLFRLGIKYFR